MNANPSLPYQRQGRIAAVVCDVCFVAIPDSQVDKHQAWHKERKPKPS